jgi:hypothetical protein
MSLEAKGQSFDGDMSDFTFFGIWAIAPLLGIALLQQLGERIGWSGRRIITGCLAFAWLWFSAVIAWGSNTRLLGFVVVAIVSGPIVLGLYMLANWLYSGVIENYEEHLRKKRRNESGFK